MSNGPVYIYSHEVTSCRAVLYPKQTQKVISERFDDAGPSARLCLEYSSDEIDDFYKIRNSKLSFETSERFVTELLDEKSEQLRINTISHRLCVVRRGKSKGSFVVEPISATIRRRLLSQIWKWKKKDRIDMIRRFSRVPGAGGVVGVLFESLNQHNFSEQIDFVATPMFRTKNPRSRWHAMLGDFSASPLLRRAQEEAPPITIALSISPKDIFTYEHAEQLTIVEDTYYVPLSDTEVAIDSFIVHAGRLYLFQFTSGTKHDVNLGLSKTLTRFRGLPAPENQYFVFIVPERLTQFSCPHSSDGFLQTHVPCTAKIKDGT